MDANYVASLVRALSRTPSRRLVMRITAGLTAGSFLTPLLGIRDGEAKKKKKKKKKKKPECPSGKQKCGNACVDTKADSANCGGCGKTCASDQACQQGSCPGGACDVLVGSVAQLRDALQNAFQRPTICLAAGTYELPSQFFSNFEPAQLVLPGGASLLGAGADKTILKGAASGFESVILNKFDGRLAWLTVTGGRKEEGPGGGIWNLAPGELALTECIVSGNYAGSGGGIANGINASLALTGCTVTGNTAHKEFPLNSGTGGGVSNSGVLNRVNTTISGNTSDDGVDCAGC